MDPSRRSSGPDPSAVLERLAALAGPDASSGPWPQEWRTAVAPLLKGAERLPEELIAPAGTQATPDWHAEQLGRLSPPSDAPLDVARRRYHARMLGYALAPQQERFKPLVTILIPVFNRAGPLAEAVQSCLAQTWRPIEILIIDDGSTDDVEGALRPFGTQVRLIRKPNGGVASARNLGLREARGDFIQLLDSDDLLCPTSLESKIAAFAAIADVDLCYGQSQWIDMRTSPPQERPPRHRELLNPIRSLIVEFAFPVPAVMMPRWRMLAMPPFDEDLRRSSDFRYWQRLGFAGVKVVGVRTLTVLLRRFEQSLHANPQPLDDSHAVALLRGLVDLFRHPHAWPYACDYLNIITDDRAREWFGAVPTARIESELQALTAALDGAHASVDGLSMLPVLAALRGRIGRLRRDGRWPDENERSAYRIFATQIERARSSATSITTRDVAFWAHTPEAPIQYHRLHEFFGAIDKACKVGGPALAGALLRDANKVPRRTVVKFAARLRPLLGTRLAAAAARRLR